MSSSNENLDPTVRSAGGAIGLPGHYICSNDIHELETSRIFLKSWICLGRIEYVIAGSGLWPVEVEGNALLVARTDSVEDNQVKIFRNFCRHRGSRLVTQESCTKLGQRIQCPYHAWTYDRSGNLVSAPNMAQVDDFETADFGLFELPSGVWHGFVWVWLGDADEASVHSLESFLDPLRKVAVDWGFEDLNIGATLEYEVAANWKLIFQNYSECYHCPSVHPALNRLTPFQGSSNELDAGPILGGPMQLSDDCQTMSGTGNWVGDVLPGLDDQQRRGVFYFTVSPTMFVSAHPDYVLIHYLDRKSVGRTIVKCDFLFPKKVVERKQFDPADAVDFWDLTNRQDWEVCELSQLGMSEMAYVPGPYSNLESIVAAFDRWYLNALGE